jgi:hypothetical protein
MMVVEVVVVEVEVMVMMLLLLLLLLLLLVLVVVVINDGQHTFHWTPTCCSNANADRTPQATAAAAPATKSITTDKRL